MLESWKFLFLGILFLTTNRVKSFDDAFCSRISMFFHYPKLNLENRREIWKNFIGHAGLDLNADDFSKFKLNGREIRNTLRTAQTFAKNKNEKITKDHVIKVISMVQEFQIDMKDLRSHDGEYLDISEDEEAQESQEEFKWSNGMDVRI